ncbi:MAG TPA: hypothetical protein VNT30_02365 [Stellaceae bacterium]|nr:hypothetical protein [Stellaceae bacterium]
MPPSFAVTACLIPLLVGYVVAAVIRYRGGKRLGPGMAASGIGLGFLAGFIGVTGGMPILHSVANHWVGTVAVVATLAGLVFDATGLGGRRLRSLGIAAALAIVAYLTGLEPLMQLSPPAIGQMVLFGAGGAAMLARLGILAERGPIAALLPMMLVALTAAGLAAIAWLDHAQSLAGLALALAAAAVGCLALRWRAPPLAFGAAALLAGGGTLLALGVTLAETVPHPPWPLLLMLPAFWADRVSFGRPAKGRRRKKPQASPWHIALAVLPVLMAVGLAWLLGRLGT